MHLPLGRRPDLSVARPAAVVMIACAAVHVVGAVRHWSLGLSLLTIAVALGCLHCVHHLWTAPRVADWVWVTLGSAAMLALHLIMLAGAAGSGHAHHPVAPAGGTGLDPVTVVGLLLPLLGLALAWCALSTARIGSLGVGVPVDDHRAHRGLDG